ncbi:hypothetical protein AA313_de0208768 [Arthrobotrys entomopaga]|nr:hypothetical protein AA313_de0208768 [Arthrobotrys entomopaga]
MVSVSDAVLLRSISLRSFNFCTRSSNEDCSSKKSAMAARASSISSSAIVRALRASSESLSSGFDCFWISAAERAGAEIVWVGCCSIVGSRAISSSTCAISA